jgi:hypothetical protein
MLPAEFSTKYLLVPVVLQRIPSPPTVWFQSPAAVKTFCATMVPPAAPSRMLSVAAAEIARFQAFKIV